MSHDPCPKCVARPEPGKPYSLYHCAGDGTCPRRQPALSLDFDPPPGYAMTQQLLAKARRDTDTASSVCLGDSWGTAAGAIFIVKGGDQAKAVFDELVARGLITSGKAVCS